MDYGKAISFTFKDKNWIGVILIGGALGVLGAIFFWTLIIPILVGAVLYGYMMQLIRDVRYNPDAPLPEWTDWGKKLADGFKLMILQFLWAVPLILIFIPAFFMLMLSGIFPDSDVLAFFAGVSFLATTILAIIYGLGLVFLLPAITINLAVQEDFSAGLDFSTIFGIARKHFVDLLIILVLLYGIGYIAGWIGMLLFLVGAFFTSFWVLLIRGHLYGQLARLALPVVDEDATKLTTVETKPVPATEG